MTTEALIQQLCAFIDEGQLTSRSRELSRYAIERLAKRLTSERQEMYELLKEMADKTDILWQRDYGKRIPDILNRIDGE